MRIVLAMLVALLAPAAPVRAQPADPCAVPGYLLFGDSRLERLSAAVQKDKALKIAVVGTGSSVLPGPDGSNVSYPAKLEAALKRRLPTLKVTVASYAQPRQTAAEMAQVLDRLLGPDRPGLVIWQTGTVDAVRGVDPEQFRVTVINAVEALQNAGIDVILMNMQYSPRTEMTIAVAGYADNMRWVAREREVPLFDRLAIMRHWNEIGTLDLYAATKDVGLAKRVHDCIGRALASQIIDAAQIEAFESKTTQ